MSEELIAVAMSGGVDSSTVAGLLHRKGLPVVGVTMQLWNQHRLPELLSGAAGPRRSRDDVQDARAVARHLGIRHHVVNFEQRFEERVIKYFVDEYLAGRTPIPCAVCNSLVKFDRFDGIAEAVGADRIATGHYARIRFNRESGRRQLLKGVDSSKDQSYFLFGLKQEQLARTRFPLGEYTKSEVRDEARELGLPIAGKRESQEICFAPNGDYAVFIDAYFREQGLEPPVTRGEIVDREGHVLGEHGGVHHFTVGQRRGLGIAAAAPLYVIATEPATQRVVVGPSGELFRERLVANDVNWISIGELAEPRRALVRIRHKHTAAPATLLPASTPARVEVVFEEPQRAVTPGQAAVFYDGDLVLGGGWISR